jgi:hypothetical protein
MVTGGEGKGTGHGRRDSVKGGWAWWRERVWKGAEHGGRESVELGMLLAHVLGCAPFSMYGLSVMHIVESPMCV